MIVRKEEAQDIPDIHHVVAQAFGREDEARLVDDLRASGDLAVSLVAEAYGRIVGHVGLSCLRSPPLSLALAPVSVLPDEQNKGIGAALVRAAIGQSRMAGQMLIFVLGDPLYYGRFGFTREAAALYRSPYSGPYFMALALPLDGERPKAAEVIYADAFANLA